MKSHNLEDLQLGLDLENFEVSFYLDLFWIQT